MKETSLKRSVSNETRGGHVRLDGPSEAAGGHAGVPV